MIGIDEKVERIIKDEIYRRCNTLVETLLNDGNDTLGFSWDNINYIDEESTGEILQWYSVSEWLAVKLQRISETVLTTDDGYYWGRTQCGQALSADGTFQKIVKGL